MRNPSRCFPVLSLWLLLAAFAIFRVAVPPQSGGGEAFERALRHLEVLTQAPHPPGTPAHTAVRDYIVGVIEGVGLEAELQAAEVEALTERPRWGEGAVLRNVMTRIPGMGGGQAVLVASHYDSRPETPGAGDASAAVAAMLALLEEAVKAAPFENDLIFLFTDGEELNLLGARLFQMRHSWAGDIGLMLNFEGRGNAGTSLMFETSTGNAALIDEYARAAADAHPVTASLFYEIYRLLPNDTDYSVFKRAGVPGLNFAFIDGVGHYHQPSDTFENLDKGSARHHYLNMAAMVEHFADSDLAMLKEGGGDAVFFDLLSFAVVDYPAALAYVLALLTAALLGLVAVREWRGGRLGRPRFLLLLLLLPLLAAAGGLVLNFLYQGASGLFPASTQAAMNTSKALFLLFMLLAVALALAVQRWSRRFFNDAEIAVALLAWWLLALLASTFLLTGASYLFLWPGLCLTAGLLLAGLPGAVRRFGLPLAALPPLALVLFWSQSIYLLFLALSFGALASFAGLVIFLSFTLASHLDNTLFANERSAFYQAMP